eukprot:7550596-Prorocentrum_lima.AAC.1
MTSSLVGSEMCIRDRSNVDPEQSIHVEMERGITVAAAMMVLTIQPRNPVSYTHLTLPTICSV